MAHVELLPHQLKFMRSKALYTLMVLGRSGGKTFAAGEKGSVLLSEHKSILACAATHGQLKKTLFQGITDSLRNHGIQFSYNKSEMVIEALGQRIYGSSYESFENSRGITNVTALMIDEAALADMEAFQVWAACCRGQGPPEYYLMTTPRGKSNWVYDLSQRPDCNVITGSTFDNFKVDPAFHQTMRDLYGDTKWAQQELYGSFVDFNAGILESDWLDVVFSEPSKDKFRMVRSYDLAVSTKQQADYTATCLLGSNDDGKHVIYHTDRWKEQWPDTKSKIIRQATIDGPRVPIVVEAFGQQKGLVQDLQRDPRLAKCNIRGITPAGDKIMKISPFAARMEAGHVRVVKHKAMSDLFDEMNAFDGCAKGANEHDDMVDAMALAYHGIGSSLPAGPIKRIKGL